MSTDTHRARDVAEKIVRLFIRGRYPLESHAEMVDAIEAAILTEREACAKVAEEFRDGNPFPTVYAAIARLIRSRSSTPGTEG